MVCDLHTHSCYSFDSVASFASICETATRQNVAILATTDHCDMTDDPEGWHFYLDKEQAREAVFQATKAKYPAIEFLYGIEIGNAIDKPVETERFLQQRYFDFVLGAIHFLPNGGDLYKLPYANAQEIDEMFQAYFQSIERLVDLGGFDSLAHLDYPLRVLRGKVTSPTLIQYQEQVYRILERLVAQKIALELNTRGTYDWQNRVGPEDWVLAQYRQLGGTYITIGSDAHTVQHIGAGFDQAVALLKETGYEAYTIYRNRTPVQIPI